METEEAAGETARGLPGGESAEKGERSVLGIAKRRPGGPAGAGCITYRTVLLLEGSCVDGSWMCLFREIVLAMSLKRLQVGSPEIQAHAGPVLSSLL
jgi:hypothetical protein